MAKKFLEPIDLTGLELLNARVQNLASAPSNPGEGRIYFDTGTDALRFFDGTDWVDIVSVEGTITTVNVAAPITSTGGTSPTIGITNAVGGAEPADGAMLGTDKVKLDGVEAGATANASDADLRDRTTHTGFQAISTVTGLQVALDGKEDDGTAAAAVSAHEAGTGVHAIDGVTGLQTALDGKLDDSQRGAANGVASLDGGGKVPSAQLPAIALTDVTVVANIATRDGLTVEEGDVAIVTDTGAGESQTYIYDGVAWQALVSPTDGVTAVTGGTGITSSGGTTPEISITAGGVGTTELADDGVTENKLAEAVRTKLNAATGALKHAEDIGDGVATSFTVTHNFNTRDVVVSVREAGAPYAEVFTDVEMTTLNAVTVRFAEAPSASQYRAIVVG